MSDRAAIAASPSSRRPRLWRLLGPGLVTGAADDDPSGIATYSQAGAQFGCQLAWTLLLTYPFMVVIQGISARLGCTTGKGIAGNLRAHYPNGLVLSIVGLLFVANTLNIGADLGAMAAAAGLLLPAIPGWLYVVVFAVACTLAQIFCDHAKYIGILKWLTFSLFAYFATLGVVRVQWAELLEGLVWPHFSFNQDFWLMVVAILGTTISPYLFFWQAAQEVEDAKAPPRTLPLRQDPAGAPAAIARIHVDTVVGMALSNLVALAILVTAAATLHASGVSDIGTAADAAKALQPLAGNLAFALFSIGIVGTGLLSIPVLAGSAAYAIGEARGWPVGLAQKPLQAKAFYGAIAVATVLGAAANMLDLNPVKALVWAAVLNGIVAVPVMVMLMLMGTSRAVMGKLPISRRWAIVGWAATAVMAVASGAFIVATVFGGR